MAIVSMPNNRNFDENYDKIDWQKKDCGCEDAVEIQIRVKYTSGDPPYLATCSAYPDMQIRAADPTEAFEKAERWIAQLKAEVQ